MNAFERWYYRSALVDLLPSFSHVWKFALCALLAWLSTVGAVYFKETHERFEVSNIWGEVTSLWLQLGSSACVMFLVLSIVAAVVVGINILVQWQLENAERNSCCD